MTNRKLFIRLAIVMAILTIPLLVMQVSDELDWGFFDFIIMGILLFGAISIVDLVLRKVQSMGFRMLLIASIFIVFFLIWAELAVGLFGSPFAGS